MKEVHRQKGELSQRGVEKGGLGRRVGPRDESREGHP